MYDSILFTDLDLPERTTEDYEVHPELGDRIERALMLALSQVLPITIAGHSLWKMNGEAEDPSLFE